MGRTLSALSLSGSVQSKVPTLNNLQRTGSRVNYEMKLVFDGNPTSTTLYLVIPGANNFGVLDGQQPEEVVVVPLLQLVILPENIAFHTTKILVSQTYHAPQNTLDSLQASALELAMVLLVPSYLIVGGVGLVHPTGHVRVPV